MFLDPPASCKVYTPPPLAKAMVNALGDRPGMLWLEPSHGNGVFIESIAQLGVQKDRVVAIDLDPQICGADRLATTFRGVDFLKWARETRIRFDRIVGNPPFISIKRLPLNLQKSAASVLDLDGLPVGRTANVWYSFVLSSLCLLNHGGCLAFVLPSAAEFANYSAAIRQTLRDTFDSLEIYRCERPLFQGVQEGTVVAIARGYGNSPCMVSRRSFETCDDLIRALSQSGRRNGHKCPSGNSRWSGSTITLETVADIRLGGVTGDASYFLMTENKRLALELPTAALTPVVSRAKHLRSAFINRDKWNELKSSDERIWLFNPPEPLISNPKVGNYLNRDISDAGCTRDAYKISIRETWYRTPMPRTPHAFLSGMSQCGPWLCINEMQGLNATNTLYVVHFRSREKEAWYMWALALLSTVAQRQIRRLGRKYAGGLIKYEPGSLSKIKLPVLKPNSNYQSVYVRAVEALLNGDRAMVKDIADSALSR